MLADFYFIGLILAIIEVKKSSCGSRDLCYDCHSNSDESEVKVKCHVITGVYTMTSRSDHAYDLVASIPRGACRINITHTNYGKTSLAIRMSVGGSVISLHTGPQDFNSSRRYPLAGTTFLHQLVAGVAPAVVASAKLQQQQQQQSGDLLFSNARIGVIENISASGPTNASLDIMVRTDRSLGRGITYTYHVHRYNGWASPHHHRHNRDSRNILTNSGDI